MTWTDLLDALYSDSWNRSLGRFRSPFAFRGQPRGSDDLSSGLLRLAAGRPDVARLELGLLRNFRKYAYGQGGTDRVRANARHGTTQVLKTDSYHCAQCGHFIRSDESQPAPAAKPAPVEEESATP